MPLKFYNRKNKAKWVLKMDAGLVGECVLGFSALPGFASSRQCTGFSRLFSAMEPYGLQEDDERDEERENTGRKKK
jgi:hypothetical protein